MLWWILQNVLIVAILAGVVSLVCRWKRLSPAARHALWLVVLVKLVTPPLFVWPWAVPISTEIVSGEIPENPSRQLPLAIQDLQLPAVHEPLQLNESETDDLIVRSETFVIPLNGEFDAGQTASPAPILPEMQSVTSPDRGSFVIPQQWLFWGSLLWIAGTVWMVLWQGLRIRKITRLVKQARPAPEQLIRLVQETAVLLPVRAPQIRLVRKISTPMLWAWGKPVLLWPEGLSDQLSPDARRGVILHELAHLKRKDHWVGRLELAAGCLWWCNPLFWYVRHQLRENAELACDAWVTETLPEGRRDYADALLTVCENYSHPAVPLPALGMGKSTRRTLERRLTMILRDRVPFRVSGWGAAAVLLLGLLILPGWSQSTSESKQLPEAASTAEADGGTKAVVSADIVLDEPDVVSEGKVITKGLNFEEIIEVQPEIQLKEVEIKVQPDVQFKNVENAGSPGVTIANGQNEPNETANRERKLQELERRLQLLLKDIQKLQGKSNVSQSQPAPKQEEQKSEDSPINSAQQKLSEARLKQVEAELEHAQRLAKKGYISPIEVEVKQLEWQNARQEAQAGKLAGGQTNAAATTGSATTKRDNPAEVVETKTITLVRTTYRVSRVDAKSLEAFLKKVVHADVLQIELSSIRGMEPKFTRDSEIAGIAFEVKVHDTITVTTTPETQEYIGRLIALIEKAPRKQSSRKSTPGTPGGTGYPQSPGSSSFKPSDGDSEYSESRTSAQGALEYQAVQPGANRGRRAKSSVPQY